MLGWNPGTEQELFTLPELVQAFSLDKVSKSGAKFNPDKAKWFNREYLRKRSDKELAALFLPVLAEKGIQATPEFVEGVVALTKERVNFVQDFWTVAACLFVAPAQYAQYGVKAGAASEKPVDPNRPVDPRAKVWDDSATAPFLAKDVDKFYKADIYEAALEAMQAAEPDKLEDYIREHEMPMGKVMNTLRLFLVGKSV